MSQTVIIPLSQLPFSLLGQNKPFLAAQQHTTAQPTPCPPTTCLIILRKDPSFHYRYYSSGESMLTFVIDTCCFRPSNTLLLSWGKTSHLEESPFSHWAYSNGIYLNSGHLFSGQWPSKLTHARIVGVILLSGEKTENGWAGSSFLVGMFKQDHVGLLEVPGPICSESTLYPVSLLFKLARVDFRHLTQRTLTDTALFPLACSICIMNLSGYACLVTSNSV